MKLNKLAILALSIVLIFTSCSNDDDSTTPVVPLGDYENGIIITEEGNFTNGTGSISFVSNDLEYVENTVYENVNGETLGNLVQSMAFDGNLGYIIENGSNALKVVNRYTFQVITTISSGLDNPRYMTVVNGKGYITNWGDGTDTTDDYVAVLDLNSNTITSNIAVSEGPEQVLVNANKLYVSHKGGHNVNNVVSVINTIDSSLETIAVNDVPDEMFIDNQGHLIVLSSGANQSWLTPPVETLASITRIDLNDNSIISNMEFSEGQHPDLMTYSNGNAYYILNNGVYSLSDSDTGLPAASLFNITAGYAYGLSVKNNLLYLTDASFTENSTLKVYDISSGTETNSFDVGLGASKIYFN